MYLPIVLFGCRLRHRRVTFELGGRRPHHGDTRYYPKALKSRHYGS
jgi:hypothetical protein